MALVDQFPSGTTEQFGDFEEWSSCVTSSDGCPGDWSDFQDSQTLEADKPASPAPAPVTKLSEALPQSYSAPDPWGVFRECFPAVGPLVSDRDDHETPTLSELLRSPSHTQVAQSTGLSSGAMSVCTRLLCEGSAVRISGPRLNTHSFNQLTNTLPLVDPHTHNTQDMALPDMELEKSEAPPAALIQTKLLAPPYCRKAPPFLYQVSLGWLRLSNLQLQAQKHAKGLLK